MQIFGIVICVLVAVRLGQSIWSSVQLQRRARQHDALAADLMRERIAAVNALRTRREERNLHWNGYRKFRLQRKIEEADGVCSFYLVPHDGKPLPPFYPGQFLTFRIDLPGTNHGERKTTVRCYSLSDAPPRSHSAEDNYYRITVKRVPAVEEKSLPAGLVSNFLHDSVSVGDILDVQAPRGDFYLEPDSPDPVVLVGGGVGVTPVLSMTEAILRTGRDRQIYFFYGVRSGRDHAMKDRLRTLEQMHTNFHLYVCYSSPQQDDQEGIDYSIRGRVTADLIKSIVKVCNFNFYICGPPPMMNTLVPDLENWGVSKNRIHMEAFGPATVKTTASKPKPAETGSAQPKVTVQFSKSDKTIPWDDAYASLLDLALENSIHLDSGCRAGSCGSCEVAIKSGSIEYTSDSRTECDSGSCLACVSIPSEDVVLDA